MAEAKKTATKKPTTVKKANVVRSLEDLQKDLLAKQQEMMETRRSHQNGELVNPLVLRTTRKEIARLHTAIRAAELTSAKESK
jgi:ribosomal protein L29